MKNEKGYALVTVLLTVVLIVTVSTVLMSSVLSSRKLVNISEEEMQAIDLAEMGVKHFTSELEDILSEINSTPEKYPNKNNIDETIIEQLNNKFSNEFTVNNNEKYKYKVKDINKSRENNNINFTFTSTGEVNNGTRLQKKDITGNLSILVHPANSDENIFDDPKLKDKLCKTGEKESYEITYDNKVYTVYPSGFTIGKDTIDGNIITCGLEVHKKPEKAIFYGDLIVLGDIKQNVISNLPKITINGNTRFDSLEIRTNGEFIVNGDFAKFTKLNVKNHTNTKINGDIFIKDLQLWPNARLEVTKNAYICNKNDKGELKVHGTLSNSCETPPTSNDSFRLVLLNDLTVEYK